MKVFISWSGDRVIHWWLPHVLQFVKPYFTPSDIDKGKRWSSDISKELEQSKIGLIAMNEENLTSPWIMFEAGAISKVVEEGLVCPIVFGIAKTDLVGPLASFQAIEFNRAELHQLLSTINKAAREAALPERRVDEAFGMWWPELEKKVAAIPSTPPPSRPRRQDRELLEEIVENTRSLIREFQWYQSHPHIINPASNIEPGTAWPGRGDVQGTPRVQGIPLGPITLKSE
jgi:TIR domain